MLLSELDREGVSLNDDVTADLVGGPSGSGGVDDGLRDLEVVSLADCLEGPCPSHVDDALVENLQCDVQVGKGSHSVDQAHAHLRLLKGLSEYCVIVEYRVKFVLEVARTAQIQILVLGAAVEYIGDSAELEWEVQ